MSRVNTEVKKFSHFSIIIVMKGIFRQPPNPVDGTFSTLESKVEDRRNKGEEGGVIDYLFTIYDL